MGLRAKEKTKRRRETPLETADGRRVVSKVSTRYIHCAPRKVALLANLIRNQPVGQALETLKFTHRPSAMPYMERALKSAIANALNEVAEPEQLVVGEIRVEGAPMMKRFRAASMGRGARIRKRLSHLVIYLTES